MLVPMKPMLEAARAGGYAVGAFEFWSLDSAQAVVEAAESLGVPVILQVGTFEIGYAGLTALTRIARGVADQAAAEVALHLDHGDTLELARATIDAGFTSVMIDASHLPYAENVELTRKVVEIASPHGVSVESELGRLAGTESAASVSEEEAAQTDPQKAERFVRETGIDALAVAIGTAHGFYAYVPRLNLDRLARIAGRVPIPLVLHGGSGTPDDQVRRAIALGISKVNICTEFVAAFGRAYTNAQQQLGFRYSVPSLFAAGKAAAKDLALSKLRLLSGQAHSP